MLKEVFFLLFLFQVCCWADQINGVIKATDSGNDFTVSTISKLVYGPNSNLLYALAYGGNVYTFNASDMSLISAWTSTYTKMTTPLNLLLDETRNRLYVTTDCASCQYEDVFGAILDTTDMTTPLDTLAWKLSNAGDFQIPSAHDIAVRVDQTIYYVRGRSSAGDGPYITIFDVAGDSWSVSGSKRDLSSLTGNYFDIYAATYQSPKISIWGIMPDTFDYAILVHDLSGNDTTAFDSSYIPSTDPFSTSQSPIPQMQPGVTYMSNSYLYVPYRATNGIDIDSAVIQYNYKASSLSQFVKTSFIVEEQLDFYATYVDEEAKILYIATLDGKLLKYKFTDDGGTTPMSISTPYYNGDQLIDSDITTIKAFSPDNTGDSFFVSSDKGLYKYFLFLFNVFSQILLSI